MTTVASSPVPTDLKQMSDLVAPLPTEPVVAETIHPIQEALDEQAPETIHPIQEALKEQAPEQKVDMFQETPKTASKISFEDYLDLSELAFEWGDSYDDKDWKRLERILAPELNVDYSEVNGHHWPAMKAADFLGIMSHVGFVGDPLVHTQHHIGASKWEKLNDDFVVGHHQLRAAHQRYTGPDKQTVENKGHGHATIKHLYRRIDMNDGRGKVWKFAGLRPRVRWNEFEFDKIFKGYGDEHKDAYHEQTTGPELFNGE